MTARTHEDAANVIRSRFQSEVGTALSVDVLYDNAPGEPPTDGSRFVRLTILWGQGQQTEFGGPKVFRDVGVATAQVFVPVQVGDRPALALAELIVKKFRARDVGAGVTFRTPYLTAVGRTGEHYQVNVTCPFIFRTLGTFETELPPLLAGSVALPVAALGVAYSETIELAQGEVNTWRISAGELPVGLALSDAGVISGTPTVLGTKEFTVEVIGPNGVDRKEHSIQVANALPALPGSLGALDASVEGQFIRWASNTDRVQQWSGTLGKQNFVNHAYSTLGNDRIPELDSVADADGNKWLHVTERRGLSAIQSKTNPAEVQFSISDAYVGAVVKDLGVPGSGEHQQVLNTISTQFRFGLNLREDGAGGLEVVATVNDGSVREVSAPVVDLTGPHFIEARVKDGNLGLRVNFGAWSELSIGTPVGFAAHYSIGRLYPEDPGPNAKFSVALILTGDEELSNSDFTAIDNYTQARFPALV